MWCNQYGCQGRSVVDVVFQVETFTEGATKGTRLKNGCKKYCAVITLEIKNAFNSASWVHFKQALQNLRVPLYLMSIMRCYKMEIGIKTYKVTAGVL